MHKKYLLILVPLLIATAALAYIYRQTPVRVNDKKNPDYATNESRTATPTLSSSTVTTTQKTSTVSRTQGLLGELHNFLATKKYAGDFIVVNEYVENNQFAVFSGHIGARQELVVMKHGNTWEILKDIDSIYSIADWEGRKSPCTITVVEGDLHFSCVSEYTDTAEGRVSTIKTYVYSGDGVFLDVLEEEEQSVL